MDPIAALKKGLTTGVSQEEKRYLNNYNIIIDGCKAFDAGVGYLSMLEFYEDMTVAAIDENFASYFETPLMQFLVSNLVPDPTLATEEFKHWLTLLPEIKEIYHPDYLEMFISRCKTYVPQFSEMDLPNSSWYYLYFNILLELKKRKNVLSYNSFKLNILLWLASRQADKSISDSIFKLYLEMGRPVSFLLSR